MYFKSRERFSNQSKSKGKSLNNALKNVWYNIMWSVMSPCCSLHPNLSPTLFAFKHPTWLLRSATSDCHQFKLYFYFHSTTHSSTAWQVPSIYIFIQEAKSSNEVRHNLALEVELCNPLYSLYQIIINCQQGDTTLHIWNTENWESCPYYEIEINWYKY